MTAIDDWLDGDDVELEAALADPAARTELVELAMLEVLLPRVVAPARRPSRAPRYAAVAALVVIAAMIAVLLWPHREGRLDTGEVVVSADTPRVVDTPLGPATLAPGTRATVRASASPPAVYIEVETGEVALGSDVLRAGQRGAFGDRLARRRLGPRIAVRIVSIDGAKLDAMLLPSGVAKSFVISRTAEIAPDVRPGDPVTLIVSPDEHEVFVISR